LFEEPGREYLYDSPVGLGLLPGLLNGFLINLIL
jgi:hypothetical protein